MSQIHFKPLRSRSPLLSIPIVGNVLKKVKEGIGQMAYSGIYLMLKLLLYLGTGVDL